MPVSLRIGTTLFVLAVLTSTTYSQQAPGRDGYAFPPGGKAGSAVEVRLGGTDWTPDIQFFVHDKRVKLVATSPPSEVLLHEPPYWFDIKSFANDPRLPREVSARFVLPADLPPGPVYWSVANANGGGPGGVFIVGTGDEITEDEARKTSQSLPPLPITVNGRLRRIEEVDRYRFRAPRTGPITCELLARQLGSEFHGVLAIEDETGKRLTEVADTEGRDPVLTFAAEKDKIYILSVRDVDYRGYRCFTYRLTLTPGPRVLTTIPAAGRRGETRAVEFIGVGLATGQPKLESVTQQVAFPSDPERESFHYRLTTPFGVTPEFPLLLSDEPETLEPATTGDATRTIALPGAVTGRIGQRGERDIYTFAGKKGEAWEFTVQARQIGSPLDVTLTLLAPDGKQLVTKDDAVGSSDVRIPLTLPADGDYQAIVADVSGKPSALDSVYRLVARRQPGSFHLRTTGIINVPIDGKATMTVAVTREGGLKEPITLAITGLPAGITIPREPVIPANAVSFPVVFECSKDAAATAGFIRIVGTARIGERTITQTMLGEVRGNLAPRHPDVNLTPDLLFATTLKPPFKVKAAEADGGRRIPRGATHLAEILIERTDGFTGEIILDMAGAQQRHRQGIRGPAFPVKPGQEKVDYPVFVPEWLETTRTSRIGLVAMAKIPDPKGTPRYVLAAMDGQITMSMEGALMKLSHEAEELTATPGQPLVVPLKLARTPRLNEEVSVELIVPKELKDLVSAKPFIWPGEKPAFPWTLETRPDTRLIGTWHFTARATARRNGHPVVSESTFEIAFVGNNLRTSTK